MVSLKTLLISFSQFSQLSRILSFLHFLFCKHLSASSTADVINTFYYLHFTLTWLSLMNDFGIAQSGAPGHRDGKSVLKDVLARPSFLQHSPEFPKDSRFLVHSFCLCSQWERIWNVWSTLHPGIGAGTILCHFHSFLATCIIEFFHSVSLVLLFISGYKRQ